MMTHAMGGFVDLHCHWVVGIDDGAPNLAESATMLHELAAVGFALVTGTPHMRRNMFDNRREDIEQAYQRTVEALADHAGLPELALASEHHFDDAGLGALMRDEGLPYPGSHAALVEFPNPQFPSAARERLFDLRVKKKLRPVLAHPERYRPVWRDIRVLDPLLDGGVVLLLDVASLVGKYGRKTERVARELLEQGYYYAACSDAHRAVDVAEVGRGIAQLHKVMGDEEALFLMRDGPRNILAGTVED
jgi:protein-tyrosine phosphatase